GRGWGGRAGAAVPPARLRGAPEAPPRPSGSLMRALSAGGTGDCRPAGAGAAAGGRRTRAGRLGLADAGGVTAGAASAIATAAPLRAATAGRPAASTSPAELAPPPGLARSPARRQTRAVITISSFSARGAIRHQVRGSLR